MTTTTQAALDFRAPQPDPPIGKVLIPRTRLLVFADECAARGEHWKANAIRTGVSGHYNDEDVPVSRGLAERWGLIE